MGTAHDGEASDPTATIEGREIKVTASVATHWTQTPRQTATPIAASATGTNRVTAASSWRPTTRAIGGAPVTTSSQKLVGSTPNWLLAYCSENNMAKGAARTC